MSEKLKKKNVTKREFSGWLKFKKCLIFQICENLVLHSSKMAKLIRHCNWVHSDNHNQSHFAVQNKKF